jgi:hypothetical protein
MRTFLITQICFVLLGIPNTVSRSDWYVTRLFDSASEVHHFSHTPTNGRQGAELKRTALAKTSIWQALFHAGILDSTTVYRPRFAQNAFLRQYQKGSRSALMLACLRLLKVQTSRNGPPYTFPKFDEYGDLPFTKEKSAWTTLPKN